LGIDGLVKVIQNGAPDGRYPQKAQNLFQLRAPEMRDEKGVPYAA